MALSSEIAELVFSVFADLDKQKYVALRFEGITFLNPGQDIDMICIDKERLGQKILTVLKGSIALPYSIDIKEGIHVHVDIMQQDALYLRYDLIDNFESFKKLSVRDFYVREIIDRRRKAAYSFGEKVCPVYICHEEDELVLRYLEFLEHYERRPKKIKHYQYIMEKIKEDHNNAQCLKILGQILKPDTVSRESFKIAGNGFVRILQLFLKKIYEVLDRFNRLEK